MENHYFVTPIEEECDATKDWSYEEELSYIPAVEEWEHYEAMLREESNFTTPMGERLHCIIMEELTDGIKEEPFICTMDIKEIYRTMWAIT